MPVRKVAPTKSIGRDHEAGASHGHYGKGRGYDSLVIPTQEESP
jgi:hypothetical protein